MFSRSPRVCSSRKQDGATLLAAMAASGEFEEVEEFIDLPDFANAKNRDLYSRLKETEKVRCP